MIFILFEPPGVFTSIIHPPFINSSYLLVIIKIDWNEIPEKTIRS